MIGGGLFLVLFVHGDVYVVLQFLAIVVSPTAKKEVPPAGAKVHHLEKLE